MATRDSCSNCGNTSEGDALYQCGVCGKQTCEECDISTLPGFIYCPSCDEHNSDFFKFIDPDDHTDYD